MVIFLNKYLVFSIGCYESLFSGMHPSWSQLAIIKTLDAILPLEGHGVNSEYIHVHVGYMYNIVHAQLHTQSCTTCRYTTRINHND